MDEYPATQIVNEDGTPYDPPKNPLWDKWMQKYPPTPKPEFSSVCDEYSCIFCSRCPKGDNWEVPEEDKEEYERWLLDVHLYMIVHNPRMMSGIDMHWRKE